MGKRLTEVVKRAVCCCRAWVLCFWPEDTTVVDEIVGLPRSVCVLQGPLRRLVTVSEGDEVEECKEDVPNIIDQRGNCDRGQGREGRYGRL